MRWESKDGNKHILVAIDAFSRYLSLYPMRNKTAAVAKAFLTIAMIGDLGAPQKVVSSGGLCFISDVFKSLLHWHELTLSYSKEENG
jgi:hypothetical protein